MAVAQAFVLLCVAVLGHGAIYVDPGLPYQDGELPVNDRIISPPISVVNPPPMHTRVYYPDDENATDTTYGVYYLVTGFGGFTPPNLYRDYMARVASHGYVVLGSWPLVADGGIEGIDFSAEAHLANIEYLKENLPLRIRNMADFDYLALGCHSAGCGPSFYMAQMEPDKYKATLNLEPVSSAILGGMNFSLPSINLGAELANNSCSVTGRDFETYYREWTCPKIMFEVADVGHCGILDQLWWERCRDWGFCRAEEEEILPAYRNLLEGITTAFFNAHLQGSMEQLEYVTNPELIPMTLLQHYTDIDC